MYAQQVKAAFDARQKAAEELRSIATQAEGRDYTPEEEQSIDRINGDLDRLDDKIKGGLAAIEREQRSVDSMERYESLIGAGAKQAGEIGQAAGQDPDAALREQFRALWYDPAKSFELDLKGKSINQIEQRHERRTYSSPGYERRDLGVGVGNLVPIPTTFVNTLYEVLLDTSSIRVLGPTVIRTSSGNPIDLPRATAHGAVAWLAEGGPLAESDPTLGKITLNSFKIGGFVQLSNELLTDEGFDVVDYIARHGGENVAITTDAAYVVGDGSGKPTGLVGAITNINTFAAGQVAAITAAAGGGIDTLLNMIYSINKRYRRGAAWLTSDLGARMLRKVRDADNNLIWQPGLQAGEPDRLLGYPIETDPNVVAPGASTKSYVFGNFRGYTIRDVGSVRFERSDHFAWNTDMVSFRVVWRTDGKMLDANAFTVGQYSAT